MPQNEIPQSKWKDFCDYFSQQHYSWIINLSTSDTNLDADGTMTIEETEKQMQPQNHSALFQRITVDSHDEHYAISIVTGSQPEQIIHHIDAPARLFLRETEEGAHEGLVIEDQSGQTTLLRFRAIALPETLDGISETERHAPDYGTAYY